jgi:hypothetical protein
MPPHLILTETRMQRFSQYLEFLGFFWLILHRSLPDLMRFSHGEDVTRLETWPPLDFDVLFPLGIIVSVFVPRKMRSSIALAAICSAFEVEGNFIGTCRGSLARCKSQSKNTHERSTVYRSQPSAECSGRPLPPLPLEHKVGLSSSYFSLIPLYLYLNESSRHSGTLSLLNFAIYLSSIESSYGCICQHCQRCHSKTNILINLFSFNVLYWIDGQYVDPSLRTDSNLCPVGSLHTKLPAPQRYQRSQRIAGKFGSLQRHQQLFHLEL